MIVFMVYFMHLVSKYMYKKACLFENKQFGVFCDVLINFDFSMATKFDFIFKENDYSCPTQI